MSVKAKLKRLVLILIGVVLLAGIVFMFTTYINSISASRTYKKDLNNVKTVSPVSKAYLLTNTQAKSAASDLRSAIDSFLADDLPDYRGSASAHKFLLNTFTVNSPDFPTKTSSHKRNLKYYKGFKYKLSNIYARYENADTKGGHVIVMAKMTVSNNGHSLPRPMPYQQFVLNAKGQLIGGDFFATVE